MCGIGFILFKKTSETCEEFTNDSEFFLKRRGPDSASCKLVTCGNYCLKLYSSVLHLRGTKLVEQPAQDNNNLLLWNGEIFGGFDLFKENKSDTEFLLESLSVLDRPQDILDLFAKIEGPWSFIYWQEKNSCLWFGRDVFGRRSFLWQHGITENIKFAVSSVTISKDSKNHWEEVPADGLYCLNVRNIELGDSFTRFPWKHSPSGNNNKPLEGCNIPEWCITTSPLTLMSPINVPLNRVLPSKELENSLMPSSVKEILSKCEVSVLSTSLNIMNLLSTNEQTLQLIKEFTEILEAAVKTRVNNHPFLCKNCVNIQSDSKNIEDDKSLECKHASVAILYSGGLDSVVLAALTDKYLPNDIPIDLLNVSFEHTKKIKQPKSQRKKDVGETIIENSKSVWLTPDRITGKQNIIELQKLSPNRVWNFVEINVTREELHKMRTEHICHIIYPSKTVLDDSIGCACWFAARGEGCLISSNGNSVSYKSPARVILLGMGADELLAGYSRHRIKFNKDGWKGLLDELTVEIDRLPTRNLGRDDRIISDHGCEARFPFLDERVVNFLNGLPVWLKANLEFPRGVGEKLLLRLVANSLNLKQAAVLPKRAIQFGSRIAHSEEQKEKGSDLCSRLNSITL